MARIEQESLREKNHMIWEHVRQEDDTPHAISMIADCSEEAINNIYKQMGLICMDYVSMSKALFGNGDPSESVVARLKVVETELKKMKDDTTKILWIVITPLIVAIVWALIRIIGAQ